MLSETAKKVLTAWESAPANRQIEVSLQTDERVLARVSDGIYRKPDSALRELIANAYDADATEVIIFTDRPRFKEIVVSDNGNGMSRESLVRLLHHIGGSAKRSADGGDLGITSTDDRTRSPGQRKLIGKLGIGLFAVAQLTRHFRIVTKRTGTNERLIAEVVLRTYSEDAEVVNEEFKTGSARVWSVPAADTESHGTEIRLLSVTPMARDALRSRSLWESVTGQTESEVPIQPPRYHIGQMEARDEEGIRSAPALPWPDDEQVPSERFRHMVDRVLALYGTESRRPSLDSVFDRYLQMLWSLSLAVPLDYVGGAHPFDMTDADLPEFFKLSSAPRGQAARVQLPKGVSLRQHLGLIAPDRGGTSRFRVVIDGVELARPLVFDKRLPETSFSDSRPLFFVGKEDIVLSTVPESLRGGQRLHFEAYLLWTPRVVPKEHAGVLVRIADASGTLFDRTFMDYQTAEMSRKEQVICEIFVHEGLEAALNLDRESFNFGHPHVKILQTWLHGAFRQFATAQKRLSEARREERRSSHTQTQQSRLAAIVESAASKAGRDSTPRVIELSDRADPLLAEAQRKSGKIVVSRDVISRPTVAPSAPAPGQAKPRGAPIRMNRNESVEQRMKAIIQVLDAFGLLEDMPYPQQERLFAALADIIRE